MTALYNEIEPFAASWLGNLIAAGHIAPGRRAELPAEVARWMVAPGLVPGGRFLDPFAGSGAIVDAAAAGGMNAIGYEKNPPAPEKQALLRAGGE